MFIFRNIKEINKFKESCLTIGSFDGLHKGHFRIISTLKKIGLKKSIPTVLITFDPHPKMILSNKKTSYLQSIDDKIELLSKFKLDYLFIITFDNQISNISAYDFLCKYIINPFCPSNIIIGKDHRFGKNRIGDLCFLEGHQEYFKYKLHIVNLKENMSKKISSTNIRNLIESGDVEKANLLLGRLFSFKGKVKRGNGLGIQLGFPTLNIQLNNSNQLIPANGVYCVEVLIGNNLLLGMCNIGYRPTFYKDSNKIIEVHVINYENKVINEEFVEVRFKQFLRKEKKYDNKNDLIFQLNYDKNQCIKLNNIN